MRLQNYTILLLFVILAAILLNTTYFISSTLTAYFGFTILSSFFAVCVALSLLFRRTSLFRTEPIFIAIIVIFSAYVFMHGLLDNFLNFTHFYWLASAVFLLALRGCLLLNETKRVAAIAKKNVPIVPIVTETTDKINLRLLYCITFMCFLESLVVLLQSIHLLPSKNQYITCTGSWINPNVTAMFLAMGLYSVLQLFKQQNRQNVLGLTLVVILAAIILLKCRTAYIITALFLGEAFWNSKKNWVAQRIFQNNRAAFLTILSIVMFLAAVLLISFKKASTNSRLQIWQNCLALIEKKPLFGYGFGSFEKVYNQFSATKHLQINDHVYMPYNDFLQLGVEGGFIAIILWLLFLFYLFKYFIRNKISVLPVVAIIIIQVTNFGFEAIPAFILFLLYIGMNGFKTVVREDEKTLAKLKVNNNSVQIPLKWKTIYETSFILIAAFLFFSQVKLAKAFHQANEIATTDNPQDAIIDYQQLYSTLQGMPLYHEIFGDSYMQLRQYRKALRQYLQALEKSSNPAVFSKAAFCYQQEQQYDSSKYYYMLVQNIEPYKYAPRMALLNLYQQQGDTANVKLKAKEIVEMPIKVESEDVKNIKKYAMKLLN